MEHTLNEEITEPKKIRLIENIKIENFNLSMDISRIEDELEVQKKDNVVLQIKYDALQHEMVTLKADKLSIEKQLEEARQEDNGSPKNSELQKENDSLKKSIVDLHKHLHDLKDHIVTVEKKNAEMRGLMSQVSLIKKMCDDPDIIDTYKHDTVPTNDVVMEIVTEDKNTDTVPDTNMTLIRIPEPHNTTDVVDIDKVNALLHETAKKRIDGELEKIRKNNVAEYYIDSTEKDGFIWNIGILGPANTPYENRVLSLQVTFPDTYPTDKPRIRFVTTVYHPNVAARSGDVGLSILQEWNPDTSMDLILPCIVWLLSEPNTREPFNHDAAHLYETNKPLFFNKVRLFLDK